MNIKICRDILEKTLSMNIEKSNVIAEILFQPSFECQGETVYCQLRQRDNEMFFCYEHFSRYDFMLLNYTNISADIKDNIFTDNYCGIAVIDNKLRYAIENYICEINKFKCKKIKSAIGLDGFIHTVIINGREFSWWCEPVSKEAKLLNEFVSTVFKLMPKDFRKVD